MKEMKRKLEASWCRPMGLELKMRLPANITISKKTISYVVKENCDALSMENLKCVWKEERESYILFLQKKMHTFRTDIIFGYGSNEMIMKLRLSIFDTNKLFFAGT